MKPFLILIICHVLTTNLRVSAQDLILTGTVRNHGGDILPKARIEVLRNDGQRPKVVIDTTYADEAGIYLLEFDRIGVHLLRVRPDSVEEAVSHEGIFYADRPEYLKVDLITDSLPKPPLTRPVLHLRFASLSSRPAHLDRILKPESAQQAGQDTSGLETARLVRRLHNAFLNKPPSITKEEAAAALELIAPGSPIWLATGDLFLVLRTIEATGNPDAYADYLEQYVLEQPDPYSTAGLVFETLGRARRAGNQERIMRYLSFINEHIVDSRWGERSLSEFAPDRSIQPGEQIPSFTFPSLDGTGAITSKEMAGQLYLLDFWATWCSPCVAERDELADLYNTYREAGFQIVSVSFDFEPSDIDLQRWPMPWLHGYMKPGEPETIAVSETFGLGALPKLILVGRDGRVIVGGTEVRPKEVDNMLSAIRN